MSQYKTIQDIEISVIIPTYNRADFIAETIASILKQDIEVKEIIIVDDGGTDDTKDIVENIQSSKIHYFYQKNQGQVMARKNAIQRASGNWIALCDSDDLWEDKHISTFLDVFQSHNDIDFYFSNFFEIDTQSNKISKPKLESAPPEWWKSISKNTGSNSIFSDSIYSNLLIFQPIFPSALIFSKEIYEKINGLDTNLKSLCSEDAHFIRRLAAHGKVAATVKENVLIRKHSGNFSSDFVKNLEGKLYILQELISRKQIPENLYLPTEDAIKKAKKDLFKQYLWHNDIEKAESLYKESSFFSFSLASNLKYFFLKKINTRAISN